MANRTLANMKIATWNVNSLSVRLPQVLDWLAANPTDVLALQELKLTDDKFPPRPLPKRATRPNGSAKKPTTVWPCFPKPKARMWSKTSPALKTRCRV